MEAQTNPSPSLLHSSQRTTEHRLQLSFTMNKLETIAVTQHNKVLQRLQQQVAVCKRVWHAALIMPALRRAAEPGSGRRDEGVAMRRMLREAHVARHLHLGRQIYCGSATTGNLLRIVNFKPIHKLSTILLIASPGITTCIRCWITRPQLLESCGLLGLLLFKIKPLY